VASSSPSSRVSSVMPSPTLSTPSGRRSPRWTLSTPSSDKAAPSTVSVVRRHDSCLFHDGLLWEEGGLLALVGHMTGIWSALGFSVSYGQSVFNQGDIIETPPPVDGAAYERTCLPAALCLLLSLLVSASGCFLVAVPVRSWLLMLCVIRFVASLALMCSVFYPFPDLLFC
jgi:hypothetical protein